MMLGVQRMRINPVASRSVLRQLSHFRVLNQQKKDSHTDKMMEHAAELASIQESINATTSSLYTPKDPLGDTTQRDLIQQRIDSIAQLLEDQRIREEQELARLIKKEHDEMMRPRLSDFKRPITSFFLLASAVYLSIQYLWWSLEGEEIIAQKEESIRGLEKQIQELLDQQKQIINGEYADKDGVTSKRRWYSFWRS